MARKERTYHPDFVKYQKFIVEHSNYDGMPEATSEQGKIKWVAAASSDLGKSRKRWWLNKKAELIKQGVKVSDHAELSPVALANHPTKKKACQTCGRLLRLEYVYPTTLCMKRINKCTKCDFKVQDLHDIFEIIDIVYAEGGMELVQKLEPAFEGIKKYSSLDEIKRFIDMDFVQKFSKKMSPGAMSNCPDRLDGFHSYNKCCRASEDTGRHKENLSKYGEDRRAYENWADGDWKAASWLMKVFSQHKVSADHIGPISLGFAHRPVFQPMTKAQNSSKGNRMTMSDFQRLLTEEENGEIVVSWHSKPIWDRLKKHVKTQEDVYELCKHMRQNMHNILTIFSALKSAEMSEFLEIFLNPEYAMYSIEFKGFDPKTGTYEEMIKTKGSMTQYKRNAKRYKRIALQQLDLYVDKKNRKSNNISETELTTIVGHIGGYLGKQQNDTARRILLDSLDNLACHAETEFVSGVKLREDLLND